MIIRTPDQRLRVFVSSTLQELAEERAAAREAITRLRLSPVMFELGARPHPPQALYRAYLDQSHIFIGIYWERYGWVAPDMDISGLEDEYRLCGPKPKLIYIKTPAPNREPRLKELLDRIRNDDTASYKSFHTAAELQQLIADDLAILLTERFEMTQASSAGATGASKAGAPTATIRIHNLPTPSTPLIGREREVGQVGDALLRSDVRMVTLFGPGGIGKTRLAIAVGRRLADAFEDGVCFVALSNISDHNLVVPAIGEALGLGETRSVGLAERVTETLRNKHMLLILDNFEQVVSAAPRVAELLNNAPRVKLIVTSRSVLRMRGEFECAVHPLALPHISSPSQLQLDELRKSPAVQLFEARAQAVKPSFEITPENAAAVAELCTRLDGLPLAIELAASRVKLLSPQAILARMVESERESLRLLSGGARDLPVRQQTLQNTLDWSYGLLEPGEQTLFARLSVFSNDGWTLESAATVCGFDSDELTVMDTLASLADKSLITRASDGIAESNARSADGDERFTMLNIIREYAATRLEASGEAPAVHKHHADHFSHLARRARSELRSANQRIWLLRLEQDNANLQAALDWLIESGDSEAAAALCWSLAPYWLIASRMSEALRWTTAALSRLDVTPSPDGSKPVPSCVEARAKALAVAGFSAAWQGNPDWAMFLLSEAQALLSRASNDHVNAMINAGVAIAAMSQGNFGAAHAGFDQAFELYTRVGDTWAAAMVLNGIERLAVREGDYVTIERVHQESLRLSQSVGDKVSAALSAYALGQMALLKQDAPRAGGLFRESIQLSHGAGYREGVAYGLEGLAAVIHTGGDGVRAVQLLGAAQALRDRMGVPVWQIESPDHERLLSDVRAQAGSAFEQAWAQGAAMPLEQAIDLALSAERGVEA